MTTITDQATISAIQAAYNNGKWQTAYNLVFDAISTETVAQDAAGDPYVEVDPNAGVDPAVWVWIGGAQKVNADSGAFAARRAD